MVGTGKMLGQAHPLTPYADGGGGVGAVVIQHRRLPQYSESPASLRRQGLSLDSVMGSGH